MDSHKRITHRFGLIVCYLLILFFSGDIVKATQSDNINSDHFPTAMTLEYKVSIDRTPGCHRYRPQAAFNYRHNEYLVVWHNSCDTGYRSVYGRRLDLSGKPIGKPFLLSSINDKHQVHPNVTYNGEDDVYMVVWMIAPTGDTANYAITGSILPWNAVKHGEILEIYTGDTFNTNWKPTPAWNSDKNQYLVIWDRSKAGNPPGEALFVQARRVNSDGSIGALITITDTNQPGNSDMVYNPGMKEFLIVWEQKIAGVDKPAGTYGARLAWDATLMPTSFPLEPDYYDDRDPAVATNLQNRYSFAKVVTYWEGANEVIGIDGALLDAFGDIIGDFGVADFSPNDYVFIQPDVAYNSAGDSLLVTDWQSSSQLGLYV